MLFCSKEFIFYFLPAFLLVYFLIPDRFKNFVIFIGSIIFYAVGEWRYIPLLLASLLINYVIALLIEGCKVIEQEDGCSLHRKKKCLLIIVLLYNLGALFIFKYITFFTGINLNITLPLGISFYTFQIVSYVVDVYWGRTRAEINIVNLGVYLCMFPQLIAGPIVIYTDISRQIHKRHCSMEQFQDGIRIFILGLGAKMLIANIMGMCWKSTQMYGIESISTPMAWLGMFAFTFQIYFDFYGYSLMAIGLGKLMGFTIPKNFDHPYMATSTTEFWRRWHITLGSWFREYVYVPLGGNRRGLVRTIFNMFVVWSLTGLWHGASWNYVLWGIMFFITLTIERLGFKKLLDRFPIIGHCYMLILIPLSWVVFGIENLKDMCVYFTKLFPFLSSEGFQYVSQNDYVTAIGQYGIFFLLAVIFSFSFPQKIYNRYKKTIVVTVILIVIFWISIYRIYTSANNPFLYFRF